MAGTTIKLKNLRMLETKISRNLFLICGGVTLVTMLMIVLEFFMGDIFAPIRIEFFYLGVLLIYSLHKELVRWLGEDKVERQGEYYVYLWIILTTVLYVLSFLPESKTEIIRTENMINALDDTTLITLEILAVFIFTRFLKLIKIIAKK